MTIPKFDEGRSAAIRAGLVDLAEEASSTRPRGRLPWMAVTAIALTSALTGGAVSAAFAVGLNPPSARPAPVLSPDDSAALGNPGIQAPAGVLPGAPVISLLGTSVSQEVTGALEVRLSAPDGATHVRATLTCVTSGSISWGMDAGGNNPSIDCTESEAPEQRTSWMDVPLTDGGTLYVTPSAGTGAVLSLQYVNQIETAWGINARGETFGVTKPGTGEPDLVSVVATNGMPGYAKRAELAEANGTTAAETFESPEDALAWQESKKGDRISIPVYESDGVTLVGEFVIQN